MLVWVSEAFPLLHGLFAGGALFSILSLVGLFVIFVIKKVQKLACLGQRGISLFAGGALFFSISSLVVLFVI